METGGVHDTTDWVLALDVAATAVGVPGDVAGVAGADAADGELVPARLMAVTVKVYEVPLVSPVTVQLVALVEQVSPPGDEVTE